jgi:hypothetical protein
MERTLPTLLLLLIVSVLGLAFVVVRADAHSRDDAQRLACIERVQSQASISLMAPGKLVDEQGRLTSMHGLAARLDRC